MNETPLRVKLFCLDNLGRWEDKGIGHVNRVNNSIEICSEETKETILHFSIEKITAFRQSDTIIQWSDKNSNNYALSFQQIEAADSFWSIFREFLSVESLIECECNLPPPTVENVDDIVKILQNEDGMRHINTTWISDLCKNTVEGQDSQGKLKKFFFVFRELINLCKLEIFEAILTDCNFLAIFKALDRDEDRSFSPDFSKYFEQEARFVDFLNINDEGLSRRAHFAHRILCLKENLMSKSFKEYTIQCLCNLHLVIWNQIILDLLKMDEFRSAWVRALGRGEVNAFLMLNETFQNSRFVSSATRNLFYSLLKNEGFLFEAQKAWFLECNENVKIKRIVIDVFIYISYLNPGLLIDAFMNTTEVYYVRIFKNTFECELEIMQKSAELIKILFNPDHISANPLFFTEFYQEIFPFLYTKLTSRFLKNDEIDTAIEVLQLLSECFSKDPEPIRQFFQGKNFIVLLNSLIKTGTKAIKISALKVIKSIIIANDTILWKDLIKNNSLNIIFKCFQENSQSEGMIFSSVLSLCKEIQKNLSFEAKRQVLNVLSAFHLDIIDRIFQDSVELPKLEIRRSRNFSFDLTASEVFVDSDKNSPTIETGELECESRLPGKRQSESCKEPEKKQDRKPE